MQSDRAQGGTRPFPGLITKPWPESIVQGPSVALELDSFLWLSGVAHRVSCSASPLRSLPHRVLATALLERLTSSGSTRQTS